MNNSKKIIDASKPVVVTVKPKKTKFIPLKTFIDKNTPCRFGRNCRNQKECKYLHNMKTRMCKFGERCHNISNCSFAHDASELYVMKCAFGLKCKNEKCTFKHPEKPKEKVEEVVVKKNNSENLEPKNFPQVIACDPNETAKTAIDYAEMKELVKNVDSLTLEGDINEMVEKYSCVKKFNEVIFKLE